MPPRSYGSIPLAIFNRNQGEIARARFAITQAHEQEKATNGQVLTDVKDAYEGLRTNDKVVQLYISKYLDVATQSRDISEYAYQRGGIACSISWMRSATIAPRSSPIGRRWLPICLRSNSFAKRWA